MRVYSTLGTLSQLPIKHSQVGTVRLIFIYTPTRTGVAPYSARSTGAPSALIIEARTDLVTLGGFEPAEYYRERVVT